MRTRNVPLPVNPNGKHFRLLKAGANINQTDEYGRTLLDYTEDDEEFAEVASLLRSRGAKTAAELKEESE